MAKAGKAQHSPKRRTPKKTKSRLAPSEQSPLNPDAQRCSARTRRCRDCGYKYPKGDPSTNCPNCGAERRCQNVAVKNTGLCRSHCGKAIETRRALNQKIIIPEKFLMQYNRLMSLKSMWTLAEEGAFLLAMREDLMDTLAKLDISGVAPQVDAHLQALYLHAQVMNVAGIQRSADEIRRLLEPMVIKGYTHTRLMDNIEAMRRLAETQLKWTVNNQGMVPLAMVMELLTHQYNMTLKFITNIQDRIAYRRDFAAFLPEEAGKYLEEIDEEEDGQATGKDQPAGATPRIIDGAFQEA